MALVAPKPEDWRIQQAIVLRSADADVVRLLRQAQADVLAQLREVLARPVGIGRDVREAQLRLVQRNLYREMEKVYRSLGKLTEARRAEAAGRAIDFSKSVDTFKLVSNGVPGGADVAQAIADSELDTVASGIDRMIARTTGASYVPLSQRVYNSNVGINQKIDRLVNSAIARGLSAREFASEVRAFINPATPGGVRYASMRLARTEINNAAHAAAIQSAQGKPWIEAMHWNLSGSHGRPDICNQYATGGPKGDGNYPVHSVPAKPHPQCLCYPTSVTVDDDEFLDNLIGGKYESYISQYRNLQPGQVVRSNFGGGFPGPSPKVPPVKPTKVAKPPKSAAKPPTASAPPAPGATAAPAHSAEDFVRQALNQGKGTKEIFDTLKAQHGMSQLDSLRFVTKVKKDLPGSAAGAVKKVTPPAGRSAAPAGRVSPSPLGVDREALARKIELGSGENADRMLDELAHQASIVPKTANSLQSVRYADTANNVRYGATADALGYYIPSEERMFLSREIFSDRYRDVTWKHEVDTNWCSRSGHGHESDKSVFAHEFGHHVDQVLKRYSYAERRSFWEGVSRELGIKNPPATVLDTDLQDWIDKNKAAIVGKVSRYSATNRFELMAEIWQEYSTMGANARSWIKKIGKRMQDMAEDML